MLADNLFLNINIKEVIRFKCTFLFFATFDTLQVNNETKGIAEITSIMQIIVFKTATN